MMTASSTGVEDEDIIVIQIGHPSTHIQMVHFETLVNHFKTLVNHFETLVNQLKTWSTS